MKAAQRKRVREREREREQSDVHPTHDLQLN